MYEMLFAAGSFIVGLAAVFLVKEYHKKKGIADINYARKDKRLTPLAGGVALLAPLWIFLLAIAITSGFYYQTIAFGVMVTVFCLIGYFDDTKKRYFKNAVGWKVRALPIAIISLIFAFLFPLQPMVLWVVPLALFIAGIASFENTFEGLNGWGTGSAIIILSFLALVIGPTNNLLLSMSLILIAAFFSLLVFTKYPAKTLIGDSGTLFMGSAIAGVAILTQRFEIILLCLAFFVPHLFDFFVLKMLSNRKNVSQKKGLPYKILSDGRLTLPKGKITMDFAKMLFRLIGPMREWQAVIIIWCIVFINCLFWLFVFYFFGLI